MKGKKKKRRGKCLVVVSTKKEKNHSKNASELGTPVPARPRGGVGGLSSLIDAIQVSSTEKLPPPAPPPEPEASPPSSPSSLITPSPEPSPPAREPDLFGEVGVGGSGWMSLGTMTRSRPRTRIAPVFGPFLHVFEGKMSEMSEMSAKRRGTLQKHQKIDQIFCFDTTSNALLRYR